MWFCDIKNLHEHSIILGCLSAQFLSNINAPGLAHNYCKIKYVWSQLKWSYCIDICVRQVKSLTLIIIILVVVSHFKEKKGCILKTSWNNKAKWPKWNHWNETIETSEVETSKIVSKWIKQVKEKKQPWSLFWWFHFGCIGRFVLSFQVLLCALEVSLFLIMWQLQKKKILKNIHFCFWIAAINYFSEIQHIILLTFAIIYMRVFPLLMCHCVWQWTILSWKIIIILMVVMSHWSTLWFLVFWKTSFLFKVPKPKEGWRLFSKRMKLYSLKPSLHPCKSLLWLIFTELVEEHQVEIETIKADYDEQQTDFKASNQL